MVVQAESRREAQCPATRKIPGQGRRQIVRGIFQSEAIAIAEPPVHFKTGHKILAAKRTALGGRLQTEGTASAQRVAELPRLVGQILHGDDVLREVPAFHRARQDELQFDLPFMFAASLRVRTERIGFGVVSDDLLERLVGSVRILVFHVEDRVDPVLALKGSEAVLPLESRKYRAVVERRLAVQIELGRPPCRRAVFELRPVGMEVVAAALGPERREVFDLEVAGFLEVVVVGHKVGAFLGGRRTRPEDEEEDSNSQQQRSTAKQSQNRSPEEEFVQPIKRTESVLYEQA